MTTQAAFTTGRAVAATMLRRNLTRFFYIICAVGLGSLFLTILLMNVSSGWWGLFIPVAFLIALFGVLGVIGANFVAERLSPRQLTRSERSQIISFSDDLTSKLTSAEFGRRNPIWIGISAIISYFKKGREGAVSSILSPVEEVQDLKIRFTKLVELFEETEKKIT